MTPLKSIIAIVVWSPGADVNFPPTHVVRIEAEHPGAAALLKALTSIGANSDATQIKQAITQGFNQLDVARIVQEPEYVADTEPAYTEQKASGMSMEMPEQPSKEVFDGTYAKLDDEERLAVDKGDARINVDGEFSYIE